MTRKVSGLRSRRGNVRAFVTLKWPTSLMICPHCQSPELRKLNQATDLGYSEFRCGACRRKSNERTGTPFNYLELPTDIAFEIVLCRLQYKLSLRNLAEMFLLRGFEFTHEAVRHWEERFAPLLAEQLRRKHKGKVGRRWYVDETYLKVKGAANGTSDQASRHVLVVSKACAASAMDRGESIKEGL